MKDKLSKLNGQGEPKSKVKEELVKKVEEITKQIAEILKENNMEIVVHPQSTFANPSVIVVPSPEN